MHIERNQLSETEIVLYFSAPMPITGTLYATSQNSLPDKLQNIFVEKKCRQLLLTEDFIYLQSITTDDLEDLELIALAEIDDYSSLQPMPQITDMAVSENKINLILKIAVAPFLQKDGGDIAFVSYQNNTITVRFLGKCQTCPYAQKTLKEKVEKTLIHYLPHIKEAVLT